MVLGPEQEVEGTERTRKVLLGFLSKSELLLTLTAFNYLEQFN